MTETLPTNLLAVLSDFLTNQMGLSFPASRQADLARGIRAAAAAFGFLDAEACAEWLLSSPPLARSQIETLASQLTVGETYFFRERQAFEALESQVLPELIQRRAAERRLRIWSAGCSTGEEPYSLAMVLARLLPDLPDWNVTLLGTDINPHALRKAAAGIYTPWSFRDGAESKAENYFRSIDERRVEVQPAIRKMVDFSYLNLVEDLYPSLLNETNALDLILCRNVLMYFSADQSKGVISRLHRCLLEGSWLVVSSTEASHVLFSQFSTVNFPGAIFYRKDAQSAGPSVFESCAKLPEPARLPSAPADHFAPMPEPVWPTPLDANPPLPSAADVGEQPALYAAAAALPPDRLEMAGDPSIPYAEGRYAEAEQSVAALLQRQPDNAKAMALRARILANRGQLAEALEWCDKAIAAEKLDAGFHYLRATILLEREAASAAADSLKRALFLDQHFVLAHFALGNIERSRGRRHESERQFQNVIALLQGYRAEEILPESEGITAGRLKEIVECRLTIFE